MISWRTRFFVLASCISLLCRHADFLDSILVSFGEKEREMEKSIGDKNYAPQGKNVFARRFHAFHTLPPHPSITLRRYELLLPHVDLAQGNFFLSSRKARSCLVQRPEVFEDRTGMHDGQDNASVGDHGALEDHEQDFVIG